MGFERMGGGELSISSGSSLDVFVSGGWEETGKSVSVSEEYSVLSETELSKPLSYVAPLLLHAAKPSDAKRQQSAHTHINLDFNFFIFTSFFVNLPKNIVKDSANLL